MSTLTTLKVRFRVGGFHYWPTPTKGRSYLGDMHRHMFQFQVEADVSGLDREIEFHDLIQHAKSLIADTWTCKEDGIRFGDMSCEMIAMEMLSATPRLRNKDDIIYSAVEVWEDGECGARVERESVKPDETFIPQEVPAPAPPTHDPHPMNDNDIPF